ncbi:MAG: formate dehydrogenase subunit beta [Alphaproteobacteria bacterium]|nr:formate dehydrogenase subunit beta [Alphaproteobacteria bacterium]
MASRAMNVVRTSATSTANAQVTFHDEVVKLIDVSKCIGCKACQTACLEWNDQVLDIGEFTGSYQVPSDLTPSMFTLMRFNEWENPKTGELEWLIRKDGCMHCADPGCLAACPAPGAIVQYDNGIVDFVAENCIGCGYCVKGCPFNIPRISAEPAKAHKCTLCSDRVAVGEGPACAKACPTEAIVFGTKPDMLKHAAGRLTDLKSRGFDNAGLYNPDGVSGTHVMYVLPHADQPELYSDLPRDPRISPWVRTWKGATKTYTSLAAMAVFVVGAFVHHVGTGANRVSSEDEEKGRRVIEGRD